MPAVSRVDQVVEGLQELDPTCEDVTPHFFLHQLLVSHCFILRTVAAKARRSFLRGRSGSSSHEPVAQPACGSS